MNAQVAVLVCAFASPAVKYIVMAPITLSIVIQIYEAADCVEPMEIEVPPVIQVPDQQLFLDPVIDIIVDSVPVGWYRYCPPKVGVAPCELFIPEDDYVLKISDGVFCPPVGFCINVASIHEDQLITDFVQQFVYGFTEDWRVCGYYTHFHCGTVGSNFSRILPSGIFFPESELPDSINAVNVTMLSYKVRVDKTMLGGMEDCKAKSHVVPVIVPPRFRCPLVSRKYWFMLTLVMLMLLAILYELALAIWLLIITIRRQDRLILWGYFQFTVCLLFFTLTLMSATLLAGRYIPLKNVRLWFILYCVVVVLSTINSFGIAAWVKTHIYSTS